MEGAAAVVETRAQAAQAASAGERPMDTAAATKAPLYGVEVDADGDVAPAKVGAEVFAQLLPGGDAAGTTVLGVNLDVLNGWVPQPSPCCAGASVAGAVNAVRRTPRDAEGALSLDDGLECLRGLVRGHQQQARSKLAYVGDVQAVEEAVEAMLTAEGLWDKKVTAQVAARALRTHLNISEEAKLEPEEGEEEAEPDTAEEEPAHAAPPAASLELGAPGAELGFDASDLKTLVHAVQKRHCLHRLSGARPSTWAIGNWGMMYGMPEGLGCRSLFGRKIKNVNYEIPITAADTPAQVAAQWDKLVGAFARPRTALLFHLTNHYALIAAVRSYAGEDGEPVREVFTARKGQTPRVWLSFDEVRKICIGWTGYRIMQVYQTVGIQN